MRFRFLASILIFFLPATVVTAQTIWYVRHNATGLNNGTSWTNAFTQLQPALNAAQPGDQVWVSAGTYRPTQAADGASADIRHRSFVLPSNVEVYGGFAGNEPAGFDLTQRDFLTHTTILSGDLDQNDIDSNGISTQIIGNNAYHVVIASNLILSVLDGFTITGGNADGTGSIVVHGGGILDYSGGGLYCTNSANLHNLVVVGNKATTAGGGCFTQLGQVRLQHCHIANNVSQTGAGICFEIVHSAIMDSVIIENNSGQNGGGFTGYINIFDIRNAIIRNNHAATGAGGVIFGSGQVSNSLFSGNTATGPDGGGGIYVFGPSSAVITNVTITGNNAAGGPGGGINCGSSAAAQLRNSIVSGNTAASGSNISGASLCTNTILGNDLYDFSGTVQTGYVTGNLFRNVAAGDYSLAMNSAAINAGNNDFFLAGQTPDISDINTDIAGFNRIVAGTVDLGAYECQVSPDAAGILYVNGGASPAVQVGNSWSSPLKELADAMAYARQVNRPSPGLVKQIWVASGTYQPLYKVAERDHLNVPTTNRDQAFLLPNNVEVYGGFSGTPGTEGDITDRDWELYLTILDGNIDGDATPDGNAYHVVVAVGANPNTVLDGFIIQNGHANPASSNERVTVDGNPLVLRAGGGGLLNVTGSPRLQNLRITNNYALTGGGCYQNGSAVIRNVVFDGNHAYDNGGAFYNLLGTPQIDSCMFLNNDAGNAGGGGYIALGNPLIKNSSFTGNQAVYGAGLYNIAGSPQLDSLLFSNNTATPTGGTPDDGFGGGLFNRGQDVLVTNTRFLQNTAMRGAAIYNQNASPIFINLLVAGNGAQVTGAGIENSDGNPVVVNSRLTGNASLLGAAMYNNSGNPVFIHTTIAGNRGYLGAAAYNNTGTFTVKNSVLRGNESIQSGTATEGTFAFSYTVVDNTYYEANNGITQAVSLNDADQFLNPRPATEAPTIAGSYRLAENAWLIDKGNADVFQNTHTPDISHITTDLAGSLRIAGTFPDLGAYEFDITALPVSLLYFKAAKNNERVRLTWATAMEQNNHRFEIEHSTDGNHYTLLHTVSGAGNSTTPQAYQIFHDNPAVGVNYYRLKQFDLDGRMTIHGVRLVYWNGENAMEVQVYPNPAPGAFLVSLPGLSGRVQLQLVDGAGNIVHQQTAQLTSNTSRIAVQPVRALPQGMYILHITGEQFNRQLKVMIR